MTMKTLRPTIISLILAGAVLWPAIATLAAAPAAPTTGAQKFPMMYKFKEGEGLRYRIAQHWTGVAPVAGSAEPTNVDAEMTTIAQVWCEEMQDNGVTRIGVGTESSVMKQDGKVRNDYQSEKSAAFYQGNRQTLGAMTMDPGSPASVLLMNVLAPRPASVGQSWTVNIPVRRSVNSLLRCVFTLQKVEDTPKGQVATIGVTFNQLSPKAKTAELVPDGAQNGQAVMTFDVGKGRLISVQGSSVTNVALGGISPSNRGATAKASLRTDYAAELMGVITSEQPAPAKQ